jgi:hypothetical protein
MGGMVVENDLDRGVGGVGPVEELEKLDEFAAEMAFLDQGMDAFTPTHASWLNLIEGFFSKLARSVLRHIRVTSKHELRERLLAFISDINREPLVHTWHYKIDDAA